MPEAPDSLEAHYKTVIKAIIDGRIFLFLGAEVNLCGRPQGESWQRGRSVSFPVVAKLPAYRAKELWLSCKRPVQSCARVAIRCHHIRLQATERRTPLAFRRRLSVHPPAPVPCILDRRHVCQRLSQSAYTFLPTS